MAETNLEFQRAVVLALAVNPIFEADEEIEYRVAFLCEYLIHSALNAYVLGISGGVDSAVAGRLTQLAVERARALGHQVRFVAMRLPYGFQTDEPDARRALSFIGADSVVTVNIKRPTDAMLIAMHEGRVTFEHPYHEDFILGNIKARQRMIAQYALAGAIGGLVVGTDHAAEALMGFFTKHGDGACDVAPLTGLTKRRVKALGVALGLVDDIVNKIPTADLENLSPQRPDESVFGMSYDQIDDFLEGRPVSQLVQETISHHYFSTRHKRALPVAPDIRWYL